MNPARRMFHEIMQIALEEGYSIDAFVRRFEVARSTVVRWAKMKANPHPRIRRQIVWHIRDLNPSEGLRRKIDDYFILKYSCENCGTEANHLHTCPLKKDKV